MRNRSLRVLLALAIPLLVLSAPARAGNCSPTVFSAAGANAAAIQPTVDAFRAAVGNNNGVGGTFPDGRREVNWEAAAFDSMATPGYFYPAFWNDASPRGLVLLRSDRPWVRSVVSADSDNPAGTAVRFGNVNAGYSTAFGTFSGERIFGLFVSNVVDLIFYEVGNTNRAVVSAVGAVFVDVDVAATSRLQLYDINGALVANNAATAIPGNASLSFVGVYAPPPCQVARARLTLGQAFLGGADITQGGANDIVALDDLIWGEPQGLIFFDGFDLLQDTSLWD